VVRSAPVDAARPVTRHCRPEEVTPRLLVGRAVERGTRRVCRHPGRGSPHERDRPESMPGKGADQRVGAVPIEGALTWLNRRPIELEALGSDPGRGQPLEVLGIEPVQAIRPLGNAEELRSGRFGGRGTDERQGKPAQNNGEPPHPRTRLPQRFTLGERTELAWHQ
jgi:hypothetical protein